MKTHLIASIVFILLVTACNTTNKTGTSTPKFRSFEEVSHGDVSNVRERLLMVSMDVEMFKEKPGADFVKANKLDKIDFNKNMLITICIGERTSGGYQIVVEKLEEDKEFISVYYSVKAPEGIATTVMTQPYKFIQTAKSAKAVKFFANGELVE